MRRTASDLFILAMLLGSAPAPGAPKSGKAPTCGGPVAGSPFLCVLPVGHDGDCISALALASPKINGAP